MGRRRRLVKNNRRRNALKYSFFYLLLFISIGYAILGSNLSLGGTVSFPGYGSPLYSVLEYAAQVGTYAAQYTGAHHDSFTEEPSQNIYYFTSSGNNNPTLVNDMNNVAFANYCWKIVRTTDTGGVKLLYNGPLENNECQDTKSTHIGYNGTSRQQLSTSYYYGTDYQYDSNLNTFSLAGDVTTGEISLGTYTCMSTSQSATCSDLYLVLFDNKAGYWYVVSLANNNTSTDLGKSFYSPGTFLSSGSYMYNSMYNVNYFDLTFSKTSYDIFVNVSSGYYFGSSFNYDSNTDLYSLQNAVQITDVSYENLRNISNKYFLPNGSNGTAHFVYQLLRVYDNGYVQCRVFIGSNTSSRLYYGSSYQNNGNGTYTILNPSTAALSISTSSNLLKGKYGCIGTSATCSNLMHFDETFANKYSSPLYTSLKYGTGVTYQNGMYTLTGNIKSEWDYVNENVLQNIGTNHYFCINGSTSCSHVNYIYYGTYSGYYFVELRDGNNFDTALQLSFYDNDVNLIDSPYKICIDKWYEHSLSSYADYLEDTIFCNDSTFKTIGGLSPSNSFLNAYPYFNSYESPNGSSPYLNCPLAVNSYSTENPVARLNYKIGGLTLSEYQYSYTVIHYSNTFWTITHSIVTSPGIYGIFVNTNCSNSNMYVRPVISLKPGTLYVAGDGSKSNPYIISIN